MKKILLVEPEKCTGCRICELVCSWKHYKEFNPRKSRISIIQWKKEGIDVPMVCQQCDEAYCIDVCPSGALYKDNLTGAVRIDPEKCVGCRACITACPFGAISYDPDKKISAKCELCDQDPECVKYCMAEAITFVPADKAALYKKRKASLNLADLTEKIS